MEQTPTIDQKEALAQKLYDYVTAFFDALGMESTEEYPLREEIFFCEALGLNVLFQLDTRVKKLTIGIQGRRIEVPMEPNTRAYNEVLKYYKQEGSDDRGGTPLTVDSISLELDPDGLVVVGNNNWLNCNFHGRFNQRESNILSQYKDKRGFTMSYFELGEVSDETADLIEGLLLAKAGDIVMDIVNNPRKENALLAWLTSDTRRTLLALRGLFEEASDAPKETDPDILRALEEDDPSLLES